MKKKTKIIKAWAVMMSRNRIAAIEFGNSKPTRYTIGTWLFMVHPEDKVIPVEIKLLPSKLPLKVEKP